MKQYHRMIVLSWDAVGSRDLPYLKTLPHFSKFLERAAGCERVYSVYPSLTYPAHSSIVSGKYPGNHGVVNNLLLQPERSPSDWFWQRKYIKGKTFYEEVEKSGRRVASLLWPVTGKAAISYNLPEVLPNRPWQNQILVSFLNGTPVYEFYLNRKFGAMREGIRQPQLDHFVHASALETLKRYQPDLMLAHFTDVDSHRHHFGVSGMEITKALGRHDARLGQLWETLGQLGWQEDTNLVILGDHCQRDVSTVIYPNFEFVNRGYATVKNGKICQWSTIARECDGSCYVYVKEPQLVPEIGQLLREMKELGTWGIEEIYTGEEAGRMGADPDCTFMLEASEGFYFQNDWMQPFLKREDGAEVQEGIQAATHGYRPDQEGYQTIFFAAGPDFKPGARIPEMCLVDEGPTLAAVLGVDLGETDGSVLETLLK